MGYCKVTGIVDSEIRKCERKKKHSGSHAQAVTTNGVLTVITWPIGWMNRP